MVSSFKYSADDIADDIEAPFVTPPGWPADAEPDSETVRAIAQMMCIAFRAHHVTITANFGDAGSINWKSIHPDIIELMQHDMADHDAEYDE